MNEIEFIIHDLIGRYNFKDCSSSVEKLLTFSENEQREILRHHEDPITKKSEINFRNSLDEVLGLIGVFEVLSVVTCSPPVLPEAVKESLLRTLEASEIRRYYESTYSLTLPVLFRRRLRGELPQHFHDLVSKEPGMPSERLMLFRRFTEIDLRWKTNENLELYLDLLDDYTFDELDIGKVIKTLSSPKRLGQVMNSKKKEYLLRDAVEGFDEFVSVCEDIDRLLRHSICSPILAASFLAHFAYWFEAGTDAIRKSANTIEKATASQINDIHEKTSRKIVQRLQQMRELLERLTSPNWQLLTLIEPAAFRLTDLRSGLLTETLEVGTLSQEGTTVSVGLPKRSK